MRSLKILFSYFTLSLKDTAQKNTEFALELILQPVSVLHGLMCFLQHRQEKAVLLNLWGTPSKAESPASHLIKYLGTNQRVPQNLDLHTWSFENAFVLCFI